MKKAAGITGLILAFCLFSEVFTGCTKNTMPTIAQPVTLPDGAAEIVGAQNQFAIKLFKDALKQDPGNSNKLISPLSIYLDLSMAYNGAAGSTQTGIKQALQLSDTGTTLLNRANQALITGLPNADPQVTINIANSIWYRDQGFQPINTFLETNTNYYQAQVTGTDFSPTTITEINSWVASKTHQKIKKVVNKIDPNDIMYLINAIYFNGKWKYKFDGSKTQTRTFYTAVNEAVQTDFMTQETVFNYMHNDSVSLIELPYGNGIFNMYVLLPDEQINLHDFVSSLNENILYKYISSLDSVKIKLWLPKWEYSYEIQDMKPELTDLGMGIAFQRGDADFSNMYPPASGAYISKVVHKAYIEVNEKGTEAAAVTSIGITTQAVTAPIMDVNHPFLYVITERNTGSILFMGMVNNPKEK